MKIAKGGQRKAMKECQLEIISLKASSFCQDCQKLYDTAANGKSCPYCHGTNTYLVSGNEVSIRNIEVV